jgi:hypothetical protein
MPLWPGSRIIKRQFVQALVRKQHQQPSPEMLKTRMFKPTLIIGVALGPLVVQPAPATTAD